MKRGAKSITKLTQRNIELLSEMRRAAARSRTTGERIADRVTAVAGSWPFIIGQSVVLAIWIALNLTAWVQHWDPYPFILLNLALSFQAAYATPIIMMSQNRQNALTERQHQLDLQINLLAEQENTEMLRLLRLLCEKSGVDICGNGANKALEEKTPVREVLRQIVESAEHESKGES